MGASRKAGRPGEERASSNWVPRNLEAPRNWWAWVISGSIYRTNLVVPIKQGFEYSGFYIGVPSL